MQKRKEISFTIRSHAWDGGKNLGITVKFLWVPGLLFCSLSLVGSVLIAFFFSESGFET